MVSSVSPLPVSEGPDSGPASPGVGGGEEKTGLGKGDEVGAGEPPRVAVGAGVDWREGDSIGVGVGDGGGRGRIGET